jgi:hypothetical protein
MNTPLQGVPGSLVDLPAIEVVPSIHPHHRRIQQPECVRMCVCLCVIMGLYVCVYVCVCSNQYTV